MSGQERVIILGCQHGILAQTLDFGPGLEIRGTKSKLGSITDLPRDFGQLP